MKRLKPEQKLNPLRKARAKKRLTLAELSKLSGVPEATISRVERNKQTPRITTLAKLADALEIELEELANLAEKGAD